MSERVECAEGVGAPTELAFLGGIMAMASLCGMEIWFLAESRFTPSLFVIRRNCAMGFSKVWQWPHGGASVTCLDHVGPCFCFDWRRSGRARGMRKARAAVAPA